MSLKSVLVLIACCTALAVAVEKQKSAYCCPGQTDQAFSDVEVRYRVVKFTRMAKTGKKIVGYRAAYFSCGDTGANAGPSSVEKRLFLNGGSGNSNGWWGSGSKNENTGRNDPDVTTLPPRWKWISCPVYQAIVTQITEYKKESYEAPIHGLNCKPSELICCKGFTKSANGDCISADQAALLENPDIKDILDIIG